MDEGQIKPSLFSSLRHWLRSRSKCALPSVSDVL